MSEYDENYEQPDQPLPDEPQEEQWEGVSEPSPSQFTDYNEYVKSLTDWKVRQVSEEISARQQQTLAQRRGINTDGDPGTILAEAVREGLEADCAAQALAQAQARQDIGPIPDDPYKQERADLIRQSLDYGKQAVMCAESGKTDKAREWRERQQMVERALERLPPTPEQQYAEDMIDQMDEHGLALLMNPANAGHPAWSDERMANDAGVVVSRALERAKSTLRLPLLDGP